MTSMLQTRSEAAVTMGRKLAPALQSPIPDIDAIDRANPLAMTAYVNDIHSFYKRVEPKYRVDANYMRKQVQHMGSGHGLCWGFKNLFYFVFL